MPVIDDLKKTVDPTPFFAAVGATDLAVEKVREARLRADKARAELSADLAPAKVQARATKIADQVKEIPASCSTRRSSSAARSPRATTSSPRAASS